LRAISWFYQDFTGRRLPFNRLIEKELSMTEPNTPATAARETSVLQSEAIAYGKPEGGWRRQLFKVVFESDTAAGRIFDIIVIGAILLSVAAVLVDSVESVRARHGRLLDIAEWTFTALFTIEYVARLISIKRPLRYATSFFGIVDLIAVLPTYLAALFPEAQVLIDVRILRLLRCFRIFKMTEYLSEVLLLGAAMANSMRKIVVFLSVVVMVVLIVGTLMYVIEGPAHGFTSIPKSIYWALSTITTVGYGDIVPRTELGRTLASVIMLIGWGILAVPTGIVTAEMTAQKFTKQDVAKKCRACGSVGHDADAAYCRVCGSSLAVRSSRTP
jgi:voltage-gated potassium channel